MMVEQTRLAAEMEEHLIQAREMEGGSKFVMELQQGFGYKLYICFSIQHTEMVNPLAHKSGAMQSVTFIRKQSEQRVSEAHSIQLPEAETCE